MRNAGTLATAELVPAAIGWRGSHPASPAADRSNGVTVVADTGPLRRAQPSAFRPGTGAPAPRPTATGLARFAIWLVRA